MYESFYDLTDTPFNITPDPRFLFFGRRHREAYEHILFGIQQRKGFIQITGEVGAGKSTLCRAVLEELARISHQVSAAADDAPHPAAFSRLGVLDVLSSTPPRPSGRKHCWAQPLAALATKPGEITGLARMPHRPSSQQVAGEINGLVDGYATALILNPVMTGIQLLRSILRELGLNDRGNDRIRLVERLNEFLLAAIGDHTEVVLFIDEAQDMSNDLLEQVRLLSNLETDDRKLLQIVLIGQSELRVKLDRPEMRQLRQRITVRYHLGPLDRKETEAYILHRLRVAGADHRPSFSRLAFGAIHRLSRGVPRRINALCDKTMLCGYVEERDHLGWWQVRRAARELEGRVG